MQVYFLDRPNFGVPENEHISLTMCCCISPSRAVRCSPSGRPSLRSARQVVRTGFDSVLERVMVVVISHTFELSERSTILRPAAVEESAEDDRVVLLNAVVSALGTNDATVVDAALAAYRSSSRMLGALLDVASVTARRAVLVVDTAHVVVLHEFAQDQLAALDTQDIVLHYGETMSVRSTLTDTFAIHMLTDMLVEKTPASTQTTRTSSLSPRRRPFL